MKTHLYQIAHLMDDTKLEDTLRLLESKSLLDRNLDLEGYPNRIEDFKWITSDGSSCVLINFVKLRMTQGPGRASLKSSTKGFGMRKDEGFAEETAALFDLTHNHVVCEYNHHGARSTALEKYLSHKSPKNDVYR